MAVGSWRFDGEHVQTLLSEREFQSIFVGGQTSERYWCQKVFFDCRSRQRERERVEKKKLLFRVCVDLMDSHELLVYSLSQVNRTVYVLCGIRTE